jgi:teichuronic acid exporter
MSNIAISMAVEAQPSLRQDFIRGAAWTSIETYGSAAINFLFAAMLARILAPGDFGIAAAVAVLPAFFLVLIDTLSSTLVQFREDSAGDQAYLFWMAEIGLVLVALVVFILAPFAGLLAPPLRVAAAQLPIIGFLLVPLAILRGQLRFRTLAMLQLTSALCAGVFALILARRGWGYWALIAQAVTFLAIRAALLAAVTRFRVPAFTVRNRSQAIQRFSSELLGFATINYWSRSLDILLIGRVLGAQMLGYYNLAFRLIGAPVQLVSGALRPVLHPTFVRMNDDVARMRASYLRIVRHTAVATLPAGALLWAAAPFVVRTVWGAGWEPVIPVLRGLALLGAVQPINALSASVYMARGASGLLFRLSLANAVLTAGAIGLAVTHGIAAVAWSISLTYALAIAPLSSGTAFVRLLHGNVRQLGAALLPGTMIALAIVAAAIWFA